MEGLGWKGRWIGCIIELKDEEAATCLGHRVGQDILRLPTHASIAYSNTTKTIIYIYIVLPTTTTRNSIQADKIKNKNIIIKPTAHKIFTK